MASQLCHLPKNGTRVWGLWGANHGKDTGKESPQGQKTGMRVGQKAGIFPATGCWAAHRSRRKKDSMEKNQRTFFIAMGIFQILVISVMAGWMLIDAYKAIASISQQPIRQFLSEPILWHKIGEILLVFPVGIAFAAFYIFWKPSLRLQYLSITTPLMIIGGIFNLIAAWGFYQKPRTDFTNFMIYFGPILFLASLILPLLLRWVHIKRTQVENKMAP
jgi:hypothetical protein